MEGRSRPAGPRRRYARAAAASHRLSSTPALSAARRKRASVNRGQPLAMLGLRVDFLTAGCSYDLHTRTAAAPPSPASHLPAEVLELAE